MKSPNLPIIKPCAIVIPVQPKIILEFIAVVKVAVVFGKGGLGVGGVDHVTEGVGFNLLGGEVNTWYHLINGWDGMWDWVLKVGSVWGKDRDFGNMFLQKLTIPEINYRQFKLTDSYMQMI